ncbi:MAG TPA: amino acid ABC transporter permease [Acidimicrobiia bacterium]|nr:amino acid ABC transporter permease [Acidimicrobiia bacterium]
MTAVDYSRPPIDETTPVGWARKNLFSTWYYTLLTLVLAVLIVWIFLAALGRFLTSEYAILRENLTLLMVGRYPRDELWRVALSLIGFAFVGGAGAGYNGHRARAAAAEADLPFSSDGPLQILRRFWPAIMAVVAVLVLTETITPTLVVLGALAAAIVGYWLGRILPVGAGVWVWLGIVAVFLGVYLVLAAVPWDGWGGWLVNIFLTIAGIALAFPFGLILAMGRRSSLPAFKISSISYIEFVRGVPLISLLLMGIFVIGFFLPAGISPGNLTRVLIAIVMFESAYIAEVVRGGLQAVPKGQTEAGQALGLSPWGNTRRIILPQALRATIPAMVGQFISLYKDTTLALVVGILELLNVSQAVNAQPDYFGQGLHLVTLPFAGLLFWAGSYTMSREARRLEKKLGVGER